MFDLKAPTVKNNNLRLLWFICVSHCFSSGKASVIVEFSTFIFKKMICWNSIIFWLYRHIFSAQKEFSQINQVSNFVNCIFVFLILKDFAVFNWWRQSVSCLLQYGLCCLLQFLYHYY